MPEVPLVDEILHSGSLAYGKYGHEFENRLKEYFGVENLIVTNTFNMAILVALSSLGIRSGNSVIASPMACLASTQPLLAMGLKIIWGDVDPNTGTLDPDYVRKVIKEKKIDLIVHNHFCGYPGYIDELNKIAFENDIIIVDDAIEAFGSEYKGRKIGTSGSHATFFSFNPVRFPNTLDGGAIIFKDEKVYEKSILIRDAGIDRKRFRDEWGEINPECDIEVVGYSATPMEVQSYIGIEQMKHVDEILEAQRKNAVKWSTAIEMYENIKPLPLNNALPNYWIYGILVPDKREYLKMFREKGFYASGVHLNNNVYSVFGDKKELPGVKKFYNSFLALPSGWWVKTELIS
jgi:dTDP-4-amino-4,6-dideoxygalactose transaminase